MIQDIAPSRLINVYSPRLPRNNDYILPFDENGKLYVSISEGKILFPRAEMIPAENAIYLFCLDDACFFLAPQDTQASIPGFSYRSMRELRDAAYGKELFASFTAYHLWRWYADNRFCGRCGKTNTPHAVERALFCTCCGNIVYPRINPAVIVGVVKGDCLLITRYRTGFAHNALVAGFTEIGETLEQTVEREVMEETGVKVKNIRYYKSQPWGIAQDILAGFYCEADGDGEIHMEEKELKYAQWVRREDIVLQPNDLSLTNDMMKNFRRGSWQTEE